MIIAAQGGNQAETSYSHRGDWKIKWLERYDVLDLLFQACEWIHGTDRYEQPCKDLTWTEPGKNVLWTDKQKDYIWTTEVHMDS